MSDDKNPLNLGPTGEFPNGKIQPEDQGEIRLAVGTKNDQVRVEFGAPVAWLSMPPAVARLFANSILEKADNLDGKG